MYESSKRITHIAIVNGKDCSLDNSTEKQDFIMKIYLVPQMDIDFYILCTFILRMQIWIWTWNIKQNNFIFENNELSKISIWNKIKHGTILSTYLLNCLFNSGPTTTSMHVTFSS